MPKLLAPLLALLISLLPLLNPARAQAAEQYLCAGDPLSAEVYAGAVDAPGIPNSSGEPCPVRSSCSSGAG